MGGGSSVEKGCIIEFTEDRGITIVQLKALYEKIKKKCAAGKLMRSGELEPLRPEQVNLYDINDRIIKKYTAHKSCSYVELIATRQQSPNWFVSHWWGNSVLNMINCLEQHAIDRGLVPKKTGTKEYDFTKCTAVYWVCAYANNQHSLGGEISADPAQSSFRRAMARCDGTISQYCRYDLRNIWSPVV